MSKKRNKSRTGEPLDPYVRKQIERTLQEGVTLSCNWQDRAQRGRMATTAIHWRPPTDPSASLARVIIDKVQRTPMPLELDGHLFLVQRVDGRLVPNGLGGQEFQPFSPYPVGKHEKGTRVTEKKGSKPPAAARKQSVQAAENKKHKVPTTGAGGQAARDEAALRVSKYHK